MMSSFETLLDRNEGHRIEFSSTIDEAKLKVDKCVAEGFDTLWMGGGDGTIHVLLNHSFGSGLTYGVVPMGTVNAFAKSLEIPGDPVAAARWLLNATPAPMDVGDINGRKFLCFAGVGLDAHAVHRVSAGLKKWIGRGAYAAAGIASTLRMGSLSRFTAQFPDGKSEVGYSLLLSNVKNYAGFRLFHKVEPESGDMELFLFRKKSVTQMAGWLAASWLESTALRGRVRSVLHCMTPEFTMRSETRMFLQLDGEAVSLGSDCDYRFQCLRGAARILVR